MIIAGGNRIFEGCTTPIVYMITYDYKSLNIKYHIKPEESFMDAYVEEFYK